MLNFDQIFKITYSTVCAILFAYYRYASSEPVIADPEIIGGLPIEGMCGFLLMFTNGLNKSITEATQTAQFNMDIAYRVAAEFAVQSTLSGVAQQVVDKVVRQHHDKYLEGGEGAQACLKRDDMTLLVRNFGYPRSAVSPLPYSAVTMPYSPPTPHRTQTSLSLFIPPNNRPPVLSHQISQTPVITGVTSATPFSIQSTVPYSTPLTINVSDPPPMPPPIMPTLSPSSSHTSTIGSQPSSGTSTPQKYDTMNTTNSTGTQSSNSDTQENGERFLFGRLNPSNTQAKPDEEGYIESYVDFSDFYEAHDAALNEVHHSQEGL